MSEYLPDFAERLKEEIEEGAKPAILIYGSSNVGKSTHAMWIARAFYQSWDEVLRNVYISPKCLLLSIRNTIREDRKLPVIIVDQADLWLARGGQRTIYRIKFSELLNVSSVFADVIIFTSRTKHLVISEFLDYVIKVKQIPHEIAKEIAEDRNSTISRVKQNVAVADVFIRDDRHFKKLLFKKAHSEFIYRKLPDDVWTQYNELKTREVKQWFSDLEFWEKPPGRKMRGDELTQTILDLLSKGYSKKAVARLLGVSHQTIYNHLRRAKESQEFEALN